LKDCRFATLSDLERGAVETWLVREPKRKVKGMSARIRNTYLMSVNAFANWCVETGRLALNPLEMVARADERAPWSIELPADVERNSRRRGGQGRVEGRHPERGSALSTP